jgi:TRAP-type mannitol/chloroaromatic compound transport system permease small subunit
MPPVTMLIAKGLGILPDVPYADGAGWIERAIDWVSDRSGLFVALWSVNAVLAYTFEVVMRYLFNMPTIWVHEGSYLLFGMMYVIAGAHGLLHGAHVRVDVIYTKLSLRAQAGLDIVTALFFFVFIVVMGATSWRFLSDSYAQGERSVETWQIHYWPVKAMMVLGAALILLAGISRLIKDIRAFERACQES